MVPYCLHQNYLGESIHRIVFNYFNDNLVATIAGFCCFEIIEDISPTLSLIFSLNNQISNFVNCFPKRCHVDYQRHSKRAYTVNLFDCDKFSKALTLSCILSYF